MFIFQNRKICGVLVILLFFGLIQYHRFCRTSRIQNRNWDSLPTRHAQLHELPDKKLILIWKYGFALENRHMHRFYAIKRFSWHECPVQSCELTYNSNDSNKAAAVLFHLHHMSKNDAKEISQWSQERRKADQIWIFLTDESPVHTVLWPEYNGLFNWSMTYRSDSDIWVPYGRTVQKLSTFNETVENFTKIRKKEKLVAILGSNCSPIETSGSIRWKYVEKLSKLLNGMEGLDIFGKCLNGNRTACPGHFTRDCSILNEYKFYLAFENSNCHEYITEKVFWNSYAKFSVPIIMGPSKHDCKIYLPPHSFLHVDDFPSVQGLRNYLLYLNKNHEKYMQYHAWRTDYAVINEHGYFGSPSMHYCRLCQSLHTHKSMRKYYKNISNYWSEKNDCTFDSFSNV